MSKTRKKIVVAAAAATMILCSGCGGSKPVVSTSPYGTQIEATASQKKAFEDPYKRTWGDGTNFNLSRAALHAENQARTKMALAIETSVKAAITDQGFDYNEAHSDGQNGSQADDQGAKANDLAQSIAQQVVKNTHQIHMDTFKQDDGQYHVFVCLEYGGTVADIAKEAATRVGQQISDAEKVKMNYEFEKYRKSIEEELQKEMQKAQLLQ